MNFLHRQKPKVVKLAIHESTPKETLIRQTLNDWKKPRQL